MNDKTYTGKEMFEHRMPSEYIVPPPGSESQGQALDRMQREALERGPIKSSGVPKLGESIEEPWELLQITEPYRHPGETFNALVARSGLGEFQFRSWGRERISAHIKAMEALAFEQGATEPKPNCF